MTLSKLVEHLKIKTSNRELTREDRETIEERVIFPDRFKQSASPPKISIRKGTHGYNLEIEGYISSVLGESKLFRSIMEELHRETISNNLRRGIFQYGLFWKDPETFQAEESLRDFYEIEVSSCADIPDPKKTMLEKTQSHYMTARGENERNLGIIAEGKYRAIMDSLVKDLRPQVATLKLSPEDAEKLIRKAGEHPVLKYFARDLEEQIAKSLNPSDFDNMFKSSLLSFAGIQNPMEIEVVFKTFLLDYLNEIIQKPLISIQENRKTQITEIKKRYGLMRRLMGKNLLSDLQTVARRLQAIDLGVFFDYQLLTYESAKELLDREIGILSESYENRIVTGRRYFGFNPHMVMGWHVKRFAKMYFDDKLVEGFDRAVIDREDLGPYIGFLKSFGYQPTQSFEDEPPYIAKERHLLEFFKQTYANNPEKAVQKYKERYQNKKPDLEIFGETHKRKLSSLRESIIPKNLGLYSFYIQEGRIPYDNQVRLHTSGPTSDFYTFTCSVDLCSPSLLQLQESACNQVGITFNF